MNITLFISSLYGGGAERVTCNLANYLAEKGHNIDILTMAETEQAYNVNNMVTIHTLLALKERKNKFWNTLVRIIHLCSYLSNHKEKELYIVMLPKTIQFMMLFRKLTKAKIVLSERGNPGKYSSKTQYIMKWCVLKSNGIVFQTEESLMWYKKQIKNINYKVIPNAINPNFIKPRYLLKREKTIVSVGRLSDQKNFSLLINAFSLVKEELPDYKLIIFGEGEDRKKLEILIKTLGLNEKVVLAGNVTNILENIYKSSLFVLPSYYEGMPNALIEAMSLGLPCISTDCPVGGPRYLIKNMENGILVPVNDSLTLANAIKSILLNDDFAKTLGVNAARLQEKLAPQKIYLQWEMFLEAVI